MTDEYKDLEIIGEENVVTYKCTLCERTMRGEDAAKEHVGNHEYFKQAKDHLLVYKSTVDDEDTTSVFIALRESRAVISGYEILYLRDGFHIRSWDTHFIQHYIPASDAQLRVFRERIGKRFGDLINNIMKGSEE